jgi:hypothetical protein
MQSLKDEYPASGLEGSSRAGIQERVSKYGNRRPRKENFYCAVKMLHKSAVGSAHAAFG